MLDGGLESKHFRSHVKHLLQHILVHPLETALPLVEVEVALARRDRGRTVIVLELRSEMEASASANKLFQMLARDCSQRIHVHQHLRVGVSTNQERLLLD